MADALDAFLRRPGTQGSDVPLPARESLIPVSCARGRSTIPDLLDNSVRERLNERRAAGHEAFLARYERLTGFRLSSSQLLSSL